MVPGRMGNALLFNNSHPLQGNYLRLGPQSADCTGVLRPDDYSAFPCEKGHTLSLWIKIISHRQYMLLYRSTTVSMVPKLPNININSANGTHFIFWRNIHSDDHVVENQWHHVGLTIDERFILTKYIDGHKKPLYIHHTITHTIGHTWSTLGCEPDGTKCVYIVMDEFRVWKEQKDEHFMWLLYNSAN